MAGFGTLAPGDDWREQEAQEGLALQQRDAEAAKVRSWADTGRSILNAPYALAKGFGSLAGAAPSEESDQAAMMPETFVNPLVKGLADTVGDVAKSGYKVISGQTPMVDPNTGRTNPAATQGVFDAAALTGGASVAGTAERAAAKLAADSAKAGLPVAAAEHAPPFYSALEQ